MRLLLDSNVLVWFVTDRHKLTARVLSLIANEANELFVSRVSIWELSIKVAKGKLVLPGSSVGSLLATIQSSSFTILPIDDAHILQTESLPHIHGDPFDRLLIAQAMVEQLTILTADAKIPLYDAPVLWN